MDKKTEQLEDLMVGMEDFLRNHIENTAEVSWMKMPSSAFPIVHEYDSSFYS